MEAASAVGNKAMATPSVAVSPTAPGTHAEEDAIVEVARPVIAHGRAGVRRITVIAVRTDGLDAEVDHNLRLGRRGKSQAGKQY